MRTTQHCSKRMKAVDILEVDLNIQESQEGLVPELLFAMGARKNKKRAFLFVSKVLGKHIPVSPTIPQIAGMMLGARYANLLGYDTKIYSALLKEALINDNDRYTLYQKAKQFKYKVKEKTLVIGFAETATALGHSMFETLEGEVTYIHTTREVLEDLEPVFTFKEEHSHAVGHYCYSNKKHFFEPFKQIVLVDDELTTGKTVRNLVEALDHKFPNKNYTVCTLLDWRSDEQKDQMIDVPVLSLIKGDMTCKVYKEPVEENYIQVKVADSSPSFEVETLYLRDLPTDSFKTKDKEGQVRTSPYLKQTGRFGIHCVEQKVLNRQLEREGIWLKAYRKGRATLCMGTEEFMYIPCVLASYLGEDVWYHSTTQSPIMTCNQPAYPVRSRLIYHRPENPTLTQYIYNIRPGQYDELFWFLERDVDEIFKMSIAKQLGVYGIQNIHFVVCGKEEKGVLNDQ